MIRRRWFYLTLTGLVISLLINLFVAGMVVGRLSQGPAALMLGGDIPREARAHMREAFVADGRAILQAMRRWRAAQDAARAAIRAEPYDAATVAARLADVRTAANALQERLHGQIATGMATAPPEVRRAIPERPWAMRRLDRRLDRRLRRAAERQRAPAGEF